MNPTGARRGNKKIKEKLNFKPSFKISNRGAKWRKFDM
jgi:hypothetical protein